MTIAEKQEEIIENFKLLDNWEDRFRYIMDLGREMPPFLEEWRTEDNKLSGCQSQVWLHSKFENNVVILHADSDSALVKGLIAILLFVYSHETPQEILQHPPEFFDKIGLKKQLTLNRANGLAAMIKQIKLFALAYQNAENKPE